MTTANHRRWFRFSLRTLFVLMAAFGAFTVWLLLVLQTAHERAHRWDKPSQQTGVPITQADPFTDTDTRVIVQNADKVEAYRLNTVESVDRSGAYKGLASYPIIGAEVDIAPDVASRVAANLLDPESYPRDFVKACQPIFGVRVTFFRGDNRVDVLFCFECDILLVFRDEQYAGAGDFDSAHDELLAEVKELFPEDQAIQSLK